jgi:hypothetical protein
MKLDAPEGTFDLLDKWSQMTDEELTAHFSDKTAQTLRFILRDLASPERQSAPITAQTFPPLVREMREAKRAGSRALGDAIIRAASLADAGNIAAARSVYLDFLSASASAFYRRIAQLLLDDLSDPSRAEGSGQK